MIKRLQPFGAVILPLLTLVALSGCDMLDMYDQPRFDTLSENDFFADGASARPVEPGTVARGQLHEDEGFYTGKANGKYLNDFPESVTVDEALLNHGRERFTIYCTMCHGQAGYGDGVVVKRGFKQPTNYHSDKVRNMPVGNIFEVITKGHQQMPPYNLQTEPRDRWAIIAYIRALELSQNARVDDVPEDKRGKIMETNP